ncbi:MAG: AmmeMemoRadiSam system protein B [Clostridiales bacterium]|nr:AmmeMemoRadiSam system protein B [Clostridiales bacterium]
MNKYPFLLISRIFLILIFLLLPLYTAGSILWRDAVAADRAPLPSSFTQDTPVTPPHRIDTERFIHRSGMEDALAFSKAGFSAPFISERAYEGTLRALTLPHHAPAASLLIYALQRLSEADDKPDTVILLGPNHTNTGPPAALTRSLWQTPYGRVDPDEEILDALLREGLAAESPELFEQEHSIGFVIPWLAKFLPEAKVAPVIFHYQYPTADLAKLLDTLEPWLSAHTLLLVSVDFSHHHHREEAAILDRTTASLLQSGDWRGIAGLGSDYLDCPTLVAALLRYGQDKGWEGPDIVAHTNSGYLTGIGNQEVASYFVLSFTEGAAP